MSLGVHVGKKSFELGTASFLKAWFSTVFIRLERNQWGSEFPILMREFYQGILNAKLAEAALAELRRVRAGLAELQPRDVVWDFEDRTLRPPWGDEIAANISSLADYFVTSDGRPLLDVLEEALAEAARGRCDVTIR